MGSGAFFVLRNLKKGADTWDLFGVVFGLVWEPCSAELAADLDDSDWRFPGGCRTEPSELIFAVGST
jgi:hypothetical protein